MIINGKYIAEQIIDSLRPDVATFDGLPPVFCDVVVGSDPVSLSYVRIKERMARDLGLEFSLAQFPDDISEPELLGAIEKLNDTPSLGGLIVQLPLPVSLNRQRILDVIDPSLDVDCLGSVNTKLFYSGDESAIIPPTAAAIMHMLKTLDHSLDYAKAQILVIGQGDLVGKPVAHLLKQSRLHLAVVEGPVANLAELTRSADVIISGAGQSKLITGDMVKDGVIIIDAGTSESGGAIVGDVDFDSVATKAAFISPVPGGVGPVTVAMLMRNVVAQAKKKRNK